MLSPSLLVLFEEPLGLELSPPFGLAFFSGGFGFFFLA